MNGNEEDGKVAEAEWEDQIEDGRKSNSLQQIKFDANNEEKRNTIE